MSQSVNTHMVQGAVQVSDVASPRALVWLHEVFEIGGKTAEHVCNRKIQHCFHKLKRKL